MSSGAADMLRTREDDRPRGSFRFAPPPDFHAPDEWVVRAASLTNVAGWGTGVTLYDVRMPSCGWLLREEDTRRQREVPPDGRELRLYRQELRKLRNARRDEGRQREERAKDTSAYLDEAVALAHPLAFRLLGWLTYHGATDLERVFELFDASTSTFEGIARLHLIGAVRFDDGKVVITSLGADILRNFGLIEREEAAA